MAHKEHVELTIGADATKAEQVMVGLNATAKKSFDNLASSVTSSFASFGSGLAASFGIGAIISKFNELGSKAMEIKNQSKALGVSAEFYQGFGKVAQKTGTDKEVAYKGLEKLNVLIGEASVGSKEATEKFDKWGISISDAKGQLLPLEDVIHSVVSKMSEMTSESQKAALAHDLFGKAGEKLLPILAKGNEALEKASHSWKNLSTAEVNTFVSAKEGVQGFGVAAEKVAASVGNAFATIFRLIATAGSGLTRTQRLAISRGENAEVKQHAGGQGVDVEDPEEKAKKEKVTEEVRKQREEEKEIAKLKKETAEEDEKAKLKSLDLGNKIVELEKEKKRLLDEQWQAKLKANNLEAAQLGLAAAKLGVETATAKHEQGALQRKFDKGKEKAQSEYQDNFKQTLQEVAGQNTTEGMRAKRVLELEKQSEEFRKAGKIKESQQAMEKAHGIKTGAIAGNEGDEAEANRDAAAMDSAYRHGQKGVGDYYSKRLEGLRGISGLKEAEKNNDPIGKLNDSMKTLLEMAQKDGLKVVPTYAYSIKK